MFKNLIKFMNTIPTEEACLEQFEQIRFRNGKHCIYCGHSNIYSYKTRKVYKCSSCQKQFSIKVGTIFEGSKIPMKTWFMCMYLISVSKKGISSVQIGEQLGVTQKTAWFMLQRLREVLGEDLIFFDDDTSEVDETYVGGKEKNKHKSKRTQNTQGRSLLTKTPVLGLLSRNTKKVQAQAVKDVTSKTIKNFIEPRVSPNTQIYTDEYRNYRFLDKKIHQIVNHSHKEFVRGEVHTNGIENFWSIFKRGYVGIYHWMSPKHMQRYLNEFVFRYNNKEDYISLILNKSIGKKLSYKELIK